MNTSQKILEKVISARFLISLALTATLCYGSLRGTIPPEAFIPIAVLAIDWYFKRKREEKE